MSEKPIGEVLDGYARAATDEFIARYEALSPEAIYQHVIDLFPRHPAKIVDIGAGTGRDAAWFAAKGHRVHAVEPVRELREAGRTLHSSERITWLDDRLPHLSKVRPCGPFDCVTLCGVWQHVPDADARQALSNLARLVAPDGRLIMSLRHGPGGEGRRVFAASPETMIAGARDEGLSLVRRKEAASIQAGNRALGVSWTWLVFERAG